MCLYMFFIFVWHLISYFLLEYVVVVGKYVNFCTKTFKDIWQALDGNGQDAGMACRAKPWHAMAYPWHGMACPAIAGHAMACHGLACHGLAWHATALHAMPCHAM